MLRKFLATTQITGCETRAVFAADSQRAEALASQGKCGRLDRDVVERVILVEDLGDAPEGSVEGPWWPEGVLVPNVLRERSLFGSIQEVPLDPIPPAGPCSLATPRASRPASAPSQAKVEEAQEAAWTREFEALDETDLGMELGHMLDAMDQLRRGVRPISELAWGRFQVLALVIDRRLRGEVAPQ